MKEADGSSPAESTAHLEALSKEELIELVRLYSRFFRAVDGFWYMAAQELVDEDTAIKCDLWVWDKYIRYEFKRLRQLIKVEGDDLAAFITTLGWSPWMLPWSYEATKVNENKLTFTLLECPTLRALEKEGAGRENTFCQRLCGPMQQIIVQSFNPRGRAIPVQLPPETSQSNICCRWQFVIDE